MELLEKLRLPPELTRSYRSHEEEAAAVEFLSTSRSLLSSLDSQISHTLLTPKLVKDLISTLATFACYDEDERSTLAWTNDELRLLASCAIENVGLSLFPEEKNASKARERLILEHLQAHVRVVHESLRHGTKDAVTGSVYKVDRSSYDIVLAHQLSWLLKQVGYPHLGQQCQVIVPCVLTALDHYSPPIKKQGLHCALLLARNVKTTELRWYKDVLLDAVCHIIPGCDELWPLVVRVSVVLVTRMEGSNPRAPWYKKFLEEMFSELERHQDDTKRTNVWLVEVGPQLEAMKLVLAAHFKRLFLLLFYWLRKSQKATSILVLDCMRLIITQTWPRIPWHATRILEEMVNSYNTVQDIEVRKAIAKTTSLVLECITPSVYESQDHIQAFVLEVKLATV